VKRDRPTIIFFPEGAFGPTNNCIGIGRALQRRGARVVFVVEESFKGTLEEKGFEERLMRLKPRPEVEEQPGQFWKDFIRDTAPEFRKPTLQQLETLIKPIWSELIDGAVYVEPRLREIFDEIRPSVIVEDNVVAFPAVVTSGRPFVRIASCNPLELKDLALPPTFSGYPLRDHTGWEDFRRRYQELHAELHSGFNEFVARSGAPSLPRGEFIHESPFLNLYNYPAELDYPRERVLSPLWQRLEACVREADASYELPESWRGQRVIYLSLGSLGSADTVLMQRLIDALGQMPFKVVVSMGPQHGSMRLAQNMVGGEFVPQTAVLPQVDLVITHGGNNTVTESMYFGKPMVVLPLFWDQHDNAQRVDETGFGVRLRPYEFTDDDLRSAIERLLADSQLHSRLGTISDRLRQNPGTERAAGLIEQVALGKS
jgi:MGT family glycosyltransferase